MNIIGKKQTRMATTINNLLNLSGLNASRLKTAKWGEALDCSSIGIYFVSTSEDPNSSSTIFDHAPIDKNILKFWLNKVTTIQVDRQPATIESLEQRLNSFWLADENIIYIGQTESNKGLRGRVRQYYSTELGDRKPHAGGHWIKTLKILNELFVHYMPTQNPFIKEKEIMRNFITQVSDSTKKKLFDPTLHLPFANLELERGNRKNHCITKSTL